MEHQQDKSRNLMKQPSKINISPLEHPHLMGNISKRIALPRDWSKLSNVLRRTAGGCSKSRAR